MKMQNQRRKIITKLYKATIEQIIMEINNRINSQINKREAFKEKSSN